LSGLTDAEVRTLFLIIDAGLRTFRVDADDVPSLRAVLGTPVTVGPGGGDGRVDVEVRTSSPEMIAAQLAGFGARVEVIAPEVVRDHLTRIAAELSGVYGATAAPEPSAPGPRSRVSRSRVSRSRV